MRALNPSHALALVLVDELARCGVTDAVLAPGSRSAALALALHDDPRVRLHVQVDERSAAFCALGVGRATARPAAMITTSGSAVANCQPAVVEADAGRCPLLVLTADRPPELRHTGANQTIDQLGVFGNRVRWFVELGVAEDRPASVGYWRSTISRAVAEAGGLAGAPGPVHVNLAFREPTVPATDDGRTQARAFRQRLDGRDGGGWAAGAAECAWTTVTRGRRVLPTDELVALARRLGAVERGLIAVGDLPPTTAAQHESLVAAVGRLAAVTGWPVLAEPTSGVRQGEHVVANAHHLLAHQPFAADHRPDLVLRVGRVGLSRTVAALLDPEVPQILVDPDGAWLDPDRDIADLLVADPASVLAELAEHLPVVATSAWRAGWRDADAAARTAVDRLLDVDDAPSEPRTARDVAAHLPDTATLVVASSMPVRDLDQFMRPRSGLRVVGNRGASGIDGLVSTTLGLALGVADDPNPGPTVALAGDLSLLHDANGFLLAADADALDAVFVVVDNDGGGIFHFLPQADHPAGFERVFATPHGRDLADLARLHRLGYHRVEQAADVASHLDTAIGTGGLHLVHVRTDRAANHRLHRRVRDEVVGVLAER